MAMLSACLFLWDISWGVETPNFREEWLVKVTHVERSYLLLSQIFHKIRSARVCINTRRPFVAVRYIVQPSITVHWCRYRMYCIYANIPCEGDAGLWLPEVTGQEAPGHLRRASHHPRGARFARRVQVHRLDEVSCRPSLCVATRLCEWSPIATNRD